MTLQNTYTDHAYEAGCDEAGRGCLAGPVVASAVILPKDFYHPLLNDSKQVSAKNRDLLRTIIEKESIAWAVASCSPAEIDKINILNASFLAMHRALDALPKLPEFILVDGNRFKKYKKIPHACMVKGDARFTAIAAASILAKTHRDETMQQLHRKFPDYAWNTNMGYPTPEHRLAIEKNGVTPHHRVTFRLLKDQLELF